MSVAGFIIDMSFCQLTPCLPRIPESSMPKRIFPLLSVFPETEESTELGKLRELAMAIAAATNTIIPQNRALVPQLSFPFPNPCNLNILHSPSPSHSQFHFHRRTCHSKTRTTVKTAASDVQVPTTPTTTWSEFARNVSGEWDGFGADFSSEGEPIELPESVIPEAYREWEVKVHDWQTQCPTLAEPEMHILTYKSIKLLPTVGCEADAATRYTIDERSIGGQNNMVDAFAYQSSGCYVALWSIGDKILELEYCLINPEDRKSRVRIIQVVRVDGIKMVLQNVRVFREQWYGPFRNGEQLGGCAICDSAFASTAAMKSSEVVGVWQGPSAVASFHNSQQNSLQQLLDQSMQETVRDESNLILLPKQLWCSLKESKDGETCSEVGWLLDHGRAITSRCVFSTAAKLKEISIACESASLEGV